MYLWNVQKNVSRLPMIAVFDNDMPSQNSKKIHASYKKTKPDISLTLIWIFNYSLILFDWYRLYWKIRHKFNMKNAIKEKGKATHFSTCCWYHFVTETYEQFEYISWQTLIQLNLWESRPNSIAIVTRLQHKVKIFGSWGTSR